VGIVIRQAISSTVFSYIGALLGFLTVWFVNRVWLTSEQNGLLNLLISISLLTGSLSNLGMAGVTTRMFPRFRDNKNGHGQFLFYPLVITAAGFILFLILYFLFGDAFAERNLEKSRLFAENIGYLIPLTLFIGIFYVLDAFSRSIYLTTAGVVIKEVLLRVVILIAAYIYHLNYISFDQFVLIYCSSFCAIAIAMAAYLYAKKEFHISKPREALAPGLRKEMKQVALFSIITGLSSLLISHIDKFIVNDMLGLAYAGVFAVATYFGSIIQIPARSIIRITSSVIADAWNNNDVSHISTIYKKTCLNQTIVGLCLFLCIWLNIDNIISLMPEDYANAGPVILVIALGYLIDLATGVNGVIIGTSKHYRYDTIFMFLLIVVTVATNVVLVPLYGLLGAAFASCLTFLLYNLARYVFILYKFDMQPYDRSFLKIIGIGILGVAVAYIMPTINNAYWDTILRSAVFVIIYFLLIFLASISEDMNLTMKQYLNRFLRQ
jgi:O-antigen/teichoic acid export membrane protein